MMCDYRYHHTHGHATGSFVVVLKPSILDLLRSSWISWIFLDLLESGLLILAVVFLQFLERSSYLSFFIRIFSCHGFLDLL